MILIYAATAVYVLIISTPSGHVFKVPEPSLEACQAAIAQAAKGAGPGVTFACQPAASNG